MREILTISDLPNNPTTFVSKLLDSMQGRRYDGFQIPQNPQNFEIYLM